MTNYDDIINTCWPRESLRPRMPLNQRAKIFLPFAALTGYEEALDEIMKREIKKVEEKREGGMLQNGVSQKKDNKQQKL